MGTEGRSQSEISEAPSPIDLNGLQSALGAQSWWRAPTRLSCAYYVWRRGRAAPTQLRKCLQATRVRPQNDSSTGQACVGQIRTARDRASPRSRADAPGQDVNPSPSTPRRREAHPHRQCLYTLASGAPLGRRRAHRARPWGAVVPRLGASDQRLLAPPSWDQNGHSVAAVHGRGHTG